MEVPLYCFKFCATKPIKITVLWVFFINVLNFLKVEKEYFNLEFSIQEPWENRVEFLYIRNYLKDFFRKKS